MDIIDEGSGEAVVLVHGGASSNRQWKALIEALRGEFRVLAPNLYGAGATPPWSGPGRYSLADAAALVEQAAARATGPLRLVGHSIGGVIAMEAAARMGPRVARLVLLEPGPYALLRRLGDPQYETVARLHAAVLDCAAHGDWTGVAGHFMRAFAGEAAWAGMSEDRRARIAAASRHTLHEWDALLGDPRTLDDWRRLLPARTLLACAKDTWPPLAAIAGRLREARPDWDYVELAEGGHMAPLTRPERVNPLVAGFLQGA